jgi:ubiquinone/menaquinone biosynthesis C-methylase UbiE
MNEGATNDVQTSYDLLADEYVRHTYDELQRKPLDRQLLDRFAPNVTGLICDIGSGPGHVARYLHERGANVYGIDLAPEMVERARHLNPAIEFQQGNMFALEIADGTFAGMTAFYALVNIARADIVRALRELCECLYHVGDDVLHREEIWEVKVSLDFHFSALMK